MPAAAIRTFRLTLGCRWLFQQMPFHCRSITRFKATGKVIRWRQRSTEQTCCQLPGSQIETNILFSSGSIDVSAFAGQTNEFFIGIVGGTSTNAQLTVENLAFSISLPPSLQAQMTGGNLMLSWPLAAANFSLQTTTNLANPNSWVTLTNVPAILNLQSTITNPVIGNQGFYRLIQSQ